MESSQDCGKVLKAKTIYTLIFVIFLSTYPASTIREEHLNASTQQNSTMCVQCTNSNCTRNRNESMCQGTTKYRVWIAGAVVGGLIALLVIISALKNCRQVICSKSDIRLGNSGNSVVQFWAPSNGYNNRTQNHTLQSSSTTNNHFAADSTSNCNVISNHCLPHGGNYDVGCHSGGFESSGGGGGGCSFSGGGGCDSGGGGCDGGGGF
ncbi:uncharacterized protein LOC120333015 [Styela clava]